MIVLELVTTRRRDLDSNGDRARRMEEAGQFVSRDQICLSPQGGCSSIVADNRMTFDDEAATERRVVKVAREMLAIRVPGAWSG